MDFLKLCSLLRYFYKNSFEKTTPEDDCARKLHIEFCLIRFLVILALFAGFSFWTMDREFVSQASIIIFPAVLSMMESNSSVIDMLLASILPLMCIFHYDPEVMEVLSNNIEWAIILTGLLSRSARFMLFNVVMTVIFVSTQITSEKTPGHPSIAQSYLRKAPIEIFLALLIFTLVSFSLQRERKLIRIIEGYKSKIQEMGKKLAQEKGMIENKETFIWTFSHELKNALNGLLGNLSIASERNVNPEIRDFLDNAKVCGMMIRNFIHNILDSGKLENGNLEVTLEPTNIAELLQKVWIVSSEIIKNKKLQGSFRVSKNVPAFLMFDSHRFLQIILNLVSNSVKFTTRGSVSIHVSWEPTQKQPEAPAGSDTVFDSKPDSFSLIPYESREKRFLNQSSLWLDLEKKRWGPDDFLHIHGLENSSGTLKVQVIDTGCGIPEQLQLQLFRKFSQVSKNVQDRKVGSGLGLWITNELANRLNGKISVFSKEGVGSTFEIGFRLDAATPVRKTSERHTSMDKARSRYNQLETTISRRQIRSTQMPSEFLSQQLQPCALIVDDDQFNQVIMKNYLEKLNITYIEASNGVEAIEKFKENADKIQLVLIDHQMPQKGGVEASKEILEYLKEQKKQPVPIILVTGDIKNEVKTAAVAAGIEEVVGKPVEFEEISNLINSILKN